MATRIAVTGASGFVGRHLTLAASAAGWGVVGVVRSEEAARTVIGAGGRPALAPARDVESLIEAFLGADAVVHLAQIGAEHGWDTFQTVNIEGTARVIHAALEAEVHRVVLLSGLGVARYGMSRRCTNSYFLSKLVAEVELFRSGLEAVVFRPSYILGAGGGLVPDFLEQMAAGEVARVGDGSYRMQPIGVRDAVAAILAGIEGKVRRAAVFDLVGPETVAFQALVDRVAQAARAQGKAGDYRIQEVPADEAERRASSGGFRGMLSDELDCLLCDEVSDPRPVEALLGRFLTPLDDVLAAAVRGA